MRIGVDASQANARERTGTERYAFELLHALALIRGSETYTLYVETPLRPDLQNLGPGFTVAELHWPFPRFWHQGRLSAEMLRRPPDVFFAPAHALPLVHPRRAVTMIHDVGFEDFPDLYPRAERTYHRFAVRHALRTASHILVPSRFTLERIHAHFSVDLKKITVVYHGFHPESFAQTDENASKRIRQFLGIGARPYILSVGRIEQKKNSLNLVRAFHRMRESGFTDFALVLAGKPGFGSAVVRQYITQHDLSRHVFMPGYVTQTDLPALLHEAALCVLLSSYEGFGFPVLEAFAAQTPVIISQDGSLPEIASGAAVIVDGRNVDMVADAFARIAASEALRTHLVQQGTSRLSAFSWKEAAEKTRAILLQE